MAEKMYRDVNYGPCGKDLLDAQGAKVEAALLSLRDG
jgi:hypothetical protein